MPTRTEILTQDKVRRLSEIETQYLRAKEYAKSGEFQAAQFHALEKIRRIVKLGVLADGEALQILGRVQQVLLDTFEHEDVVTEYEGLKKTLAEMYPKEGK